MKFFFEKSTIKGNLSIQYVDLNFYLRKQETHNEIKYSKNNKIIYKISVAWTENIVEIDKMKAAININY